ncbi:MAG TPA: hypothetical protein DCR40_15715 [Prolixibacteraceae bacterium]|nr:hypothetical protein [Prolixibacteraceae bacterium]
MKKEIEILAKKAVTDIASKPISRKEAIKKTGYMAVSAATMMLLLSNPAEAKNDKGPKGSYKNTNDQSVNQGATKGGSKDGGIWK